MCFNLGKRPSTPEKAASRYSSPKSNDRREQRFFEFWIGVIDRSATPTPFPFDHLLPHQMPVNQTCTHARNWWCGGTYSQFSKSSSMQHMKLPRIPRPLITFKLMITSSKASHQKTTKTKNMYSDAALYCNWANISISIDCKPLLDPWDDFPYFHAQKEKDQT